jgi:hypothetical protein
MPESAYSRINPQKDREDRINRSKFLNNFHVAETNIHGDRRNSSDIAISDILYHMEKIPAQLEKKIEKAETKKEENKLEKVKGNVENIIDKFIQVKEDLAKFHQENMKVERDLRKIQNGGKKRSAKRSTKKRVFKKHSTKKKRSSKKRVSKKRSTKKRSTQKYVSKKRSKKRSVKRTSKKRSTKK